ncbi:GT-D fold domain-containing glycosyltransferase [Lacticaseibacillus thailandensis]|uniref:GT-D fold domain-containing glycosyltransferase n=1 Tax=Lacticaseibacillus thailandensis TaxID=381741 RepID=UPI0006CFA219|nr:GT-D fold domain-containing glycosyltransferase [Lacticaseibacillus thailandensis]
MSQLLLRTVRIAYFPFYKKVTKSFRPFTIASLDETVSELAKTGKSFSRFGDGEINIMFRKRSIGFQKYSMGLQKDLLDVASQENNDVFIGLPHAFLSTSPDKLLVKSFWWAYVVNNRDNITNFLNHSHRSYFLDTNFSRTVTESRSKKTIKRIVTKVRHLWENKRVLVIEGAGTRFGVGNGLFENALNVSRIIAPSRNAYNVINKIESSAVEFISKQPRKDNFIVLIALGPTATVLASRLSSICQSIDIGHFDLQYEYLAMGKYHKTNVPTRYDNEIINGDHVEDIHDEGYLEQIVAEIDE